MKKKTKIVLAFAIGFAVAMLVMTVAIYFGYTKAYSTDTELLMVKIIGIPIFQLTKDGTEYLGESQGVFMGILCGICMALSVMVEEIIARVRKR